MNTTQFSVTTGNPQLIDVKNSQGQTLMGIQNDGAGVLTIEGRLTGNVNFAAMGTVAAATVSSITILPGLIEIRLSGVANTGTITG